MDPENLLGIASNLARIGCIQAYLPEVPLDTAWTRADKQQREMLTAHIQEGPDLWPELESAYWTCLGAPTPNCIAQPKEEIPNENRALAKAEFLIAMQGQGDTLKDVQRLLRAHGGMTLASDEKRHTVQLHHVALGESFSFQLAPEDMTFLGVYHQLVCERV